MVVGAGHNGLTAANVLADAGWQVTVFEANEGPGGATRSGELAAPGFVSDTGSAFFPLGVASPVLRALRLEEYGLVWRHAPVGLAHVLGEDRCVVISRDIDETAASLAEFGPHDGAAWRAMYERWQAVGPRVLRALMSPFPPVRPALGVLRALGSSAEILRFIRFALLPVQRMGEEHFQGEGGRLLLTGNALHSDLPPQGAGSGFLGWLLAMLGQEVGYPVPQGGAGQFSAALENRFVSKGGNLVCSAPVTEVLVRRGRARGVRLADGHIEPADAVLADVAAPALFEDLVGPGHLPAGFTRDLSRFQWDHGSVKIDWALSAPIPWNAKPARLAGVVHVGGGLADLACYASALGAGLLPDRPFVLMGQLSTADPTRAPAGMESAWAYTHVPWGMRDDTARIDEHVSRIEDVIERYAPGFRSLIVGRHVAGPRQLQRDDRNLVSGAINGGTSALHQQLVFRPVTGLGRAETPVRGLFLAGASAHPGGGVHGACGGNAARAAIAERRLAGRAGALAVRAAMHRLYGGTGHDW